MGKALRIPHFYITKNYPMNGDVIISDPDDESTSQNITQDQLEKFYEFKEALQKICAMRSIRIDFPDDTVTEKFEWWFDLASIDRYEKEMLNTKDFDTHPLIKLASLLNFEIPVHGNLAKIISKGKYEFVTLNNIRHFADEYAQETDIFGDC